MNRAASPAAATTVLAAAAEIEGYMHKLTEVDPKIFTEPPDADWANPLNPDGTRKFPPGELVTTYTDEHEGGKWNPILRVNEPALRWEKYIFWLPAGDYALETLEIGFSNIFRRTVTIHGPSAGTYYIGTWDGEGKVHRLRAL